MDNLAQIVVLFNDIADFFIPALLSLGAFAISINSIVRSGMQNGFGRRLYMGVILLLAVGGILGVVLIFPFLISSLAETLFHIPSGTVRWLLLLLIVPPIMYFYTKKYSGARGGLTALGHLLVIVLGSLMGEWLGVFFFSLPLLVIFYWLSWSLAQVVVPSAIPEDRSEMWNKFKVLISYFWGIQLPLMVVDAGFAREAKTRIDGDLFRDIGGPGIVWTRSHQVAAISSGIEFLRVDGPGPISIRKYERPVAIVDLRTQLRTSTFHVVLNNGVQIEAVLFASFGIDHEDWKSIPRLARENIYRAQPLLYRGRTLDHNIGSYPYSSLRIQAALRKSNLNFNPQPKAETIDQQAHVVGSQNDSDALTLHWDEWVMKQIEKNAQIVLANRNLDQLWEPRQDDDGRNALDEIGLQIIELSTPELRSAGVRLYGARVVSYKIEEQGDVSDAAANSWKTIWDQKTSEERVKGQSEFQKKLEEARAHTKSMLLEAIADGLQQARRINPELPNQLIALNYILSLEQIAKKDPSEPDDELRKKLNNWKETMLANRM